MVILNAITLVCFMWLIVEGFKGKVPTNLYLLVVFLHLLLYVLTFETSRLSVVGALILYYITMTTRIVSLGIASFIGMALLLILNLLI
ncbi:hypothetical protein HOS99_gp102 [Staphylococcus phage phiSA_BS1]|uniref:Uncharacterized protein n=1 Tax=Staphylococcus phage phiSA_BS1 TaxID=2126734 RepID=A0A2P1MXP0_9CAUD|nr:hypothetical protein HOS99_gp102 [Staphylococcus phage phiSA_BS1]AVP40347.1 hypothetical protein [Staphylococcus phage phiSA_BS1]